MHPNPTQQVSQSASELTSSLALNLWSVRHPALKGRCLGRFGGEDSVKQLEARFGHSVGLTVLAVDLVNHIAGSAHTGLM